MLEPQKDTIVVLDCGGQYAHLIGNRIRRMNVFSEIFSPETPASELKEAKGIIISGGPQSVYDANSPKVDKKIFDLGIPVLGICYGHQLMAHMLDGKVQPAQTKEYGKAHILRKSSVSETPFQDLNEKDVVWMSHGDEVISMPPGFELIYSSDDCNVTAMANKKRKFYGVQFHPEVKHTQNGETILENFINICEAKREWNMEIFLEEEMKKVRDIVKDRNVFLLISGGVDSTVAFVLLSKILGKDRVYGLFVDTGFMRKGEIEEVMQSLKAIGFDNLHLAQAEEQFLSALEEIYDPERKRNIIGAKFLEVKDHWAEKLNLDNDSWILGQGTIYPDTIESGGTKHADRIKTHHNRIDAIEKLIQEGRIVEPLQELYKDEVRELGLTLGLPKELVWRHPFPGPGLAIRILCAKESDIFESALHQENEISKKYDVEASILPIKSVGVQGDGRTYRHPLVLFLNEQVLDWAVLEGISTSLTNSYRDINRVLISLSHPKKPELLSFIPGYLTKERVRILQEIDCIVRTFIKKHDLNQKIWQCPVILAPVSADQEKESIILRPVESSEAMTANFSCIDESLLRELTAEILATGQVSMVFYDITHKPPATIEWE